MFKQCKCLLAACLVALAAPMLADNHVMDSGWLELVKGSRDDTTGAQLMDIEQGAEDGMRTVTVAIPKSAMGHPDDIEEVVVVGKAPAKAELPLPNVEYEWVKDYDADNHGLIIHIGKGNIWPIRLQMKATQDRVE